MGPEAGREPGVERVLVLADVRRAAGGAPRGVLDRYGQRVAVVAVPNGDAVAPPDLPADAPVADVLHPVRVRALEAARDERDAPALHRFHRRSRQRLYPDVPLHRDDRLHDGARALAVADRVAVRLDALDQPFRIEVRDHALASLGDVEARVSAGGVAQRAIEVDDVDDRQAVALADVEVDRVVAGRHLQRARAGIDGDRRVGDHRHRLVVRGDEHVAPDQRAIAIVVGVHGHGGVGRDRLRPRRGDHEVFTRRLVGFVEDGVADVPEVAVDVTVLDLEVGERGFRHRIPVDDVFAAVDEAVVEQPPERLAHRTLGPRVHREDLALPVGGGAELAMLARDAIARTVDELPDAF